MTRIAVFAYASLVDPASASLTLGREVPQPRPARLAGWRRRWSQARDNLREEKTFAIEPGGRLPPWVLGLNIEPSTDGDPDGDGPNGALLEVSKAELERLDLREIRYDRVEVTSQIDGAEDFDLVVAYRAKADHFAPEPPDGAVILATYARAVERAFEALGDGQRETYLRTTGRPPVEPVEGRLVRDRIPPGNPRAW
jgi:hypothetical protein